MSKADLTSQDGLEIKYLLQGGVPGKESLLAKPSRPLGTSLKWRSVLSLCDLPVEGRRAFPFVTDGHKSLGAAASDRGLVPQKQAKRLLSLCPF